MLSCIERKRSLTKYIVIIPSKYCRRDIDYAITYDVLKVTNINDFNFELENYGPEEASIFCFLYAIVVMRYFFTESIFYCQTLN